MIELLSLTSQLKSGRDTFNQLYKEYYRKAYLYAKSYVGDTFVAEDIASEAMITVWEKMKTSEKKELISFLFVILKNKSLDYLRKKSTHDLYFEKMGNVGLADLEIRISSLDNILVSEAESIISKTLSTFSDQTQNIFHLSRIDGLSNAEIASKIGLSEKGVEYHISKVLKTLRISLKDFLFFLILISLGRSFFNTYYITDKQ